MSEEPPIATPFEWRDPSAIPHRRYREDRPVEMDRTPVRVRGEHLSAVWWRGRQWAVTERGIEALDGTYFIAANRLTEELDTYPWPKHMTEKTWVDPDDFATAWMVGLVLHGAKLPKDGAALVRDALRLMRYA